MENLPVEGGYIVAANHLGVLDAALVYHLLENQDVIIIVAKEHQKFAIFRWAVKKLDAVWINRFNADFRALRIVLNRLRQGGVLVIAPEGTRSPTGALITARAGASYLAAKTELPLVPAGVIGTLDAVIKSQLLHFRKPQIFLRVGKPIRFPSLDGEDRAAKLQQYTDEIMCQIAMLLPPANRGVYADHPRLLELLEAPNSTK